LTGVTFVSRPSLGSSYSTTLRKLSGSNNRTHHVKAQCNQKKVPWKC